VTYLDHKSQGQIRIFSHRFYVKINSEMAVISLCELCSTVALFVFFLYRRWFGLWCFKPLF